MNSDRPHVGGGAECVSGWSDELKGTQKQVVGLVEKRTWFGWKNQQACFLYLWASQLMAKRR